MTGGEREPGPGEVQATLAAARGMGIELPPVVFDPARQRAIADRAAAAGQTLNNPDATPEQLRQAAEDESDHLRLLWVLGDLAQVRIAMEDAGILSGPEGADR
ncbi:MULTISPECIES: hypothetical protein [Nocardiopsis]|uniref:Uncharacterized protein n=1 Tax=Nocardiopsis sinuspersici TaxID=501010 RepID=A0A1V3BWI3_9ACTN|nr:MULTISPECIES: hypothetical protein [Nocardiopsis]OOC52619.1 hypothetical protein NOSIN_01225 [Nocardiopsis sinuspersici]